MRYVLCFVFPPLAVLLCGRVVGAVLNLVLTICGIIPGIVHAILVVNEVKADKRSVRQASLIARATRA
jgi:uncharacterized membrane protein YqaE (UPF0057 family)